jgi:hypothetical protein
VTKCELCGSGPIFAGHAEVNGDVVDTYHDCACVEPHRADEPMGTAYDDFHPFNDALYEGL